jgi:hypothetical protein
MLSSSKIQGAIFFPSGGGKRVAVRDSRRNICDIGTFNANGYYTEAQSEIVFLKKSTCNHTSFWFCHFVGQI